MIVNVTLDDATHALIKELAKEQRRSVSNFMTQFLSVSLNADTDREALVRKMNPTITAAMPAILKERERLERLLEIKS